MSSSLEPQKESAVAKSRYLVVLLSLMMLTATVPHASRAKQQSSPLSNVKTNHQKTEFVPGEVLVRFRTGAAAKSLSQMATTLKVEGRELPVAVERLEASDLVEGLRLARVQPEDTLHTVAALRARPDVLYAELNYIRRIDRTPNDPRFAEQWALKNTGQSGGTAGVDIKAEQAWDTTTGDRSIVVGVIDEGIDINHPDLRDNIWRNAGEVPGNNVDDDGNGFVDDYNGYDFFHNDASVYDGSPGDNETDSHGTHVAGTIGAVGNNSVGVTGVNWQVSLMSLKILGRDGERPAPSSVRLTVRAYGYAKMMRDLWVSSGGTRGANIRVLNNSYGGFGNSQTELDAIRALGESGILFVASAGNESLSNDSSPHFPSGYNAPNVISVTATNRLDTLSSFSNTGALTVHMAAPGSAILSTTPNGTYSSFSGTSMAAPHVAGAAALIYAVYPNLSAPRLRAALLFSGDEISAVIGKTLTGRRLNALGALQNAPEADAAPPAVIQDLRVVSQNGRSITLEWTAPGDDDNTGRASLYEIRFSDNNLNSSSAFNEALSFVAPIPAAAGTLQTATVQVPYRHPAGFFGIRAVDNAGNLSAVASVSVLVDPAAADPYVVSQSGSAGLSTGGTPLALIGDDRYKEGYALPFAFPFFGQNHPTVTISINGLLYFSPPPKYEPQPPVAPQDNADDAGSSVDGLNARAMIAGMWDDLRTDRRPGDDVYVVTPDADRIIFRWQGVTFNGEAPVNFEVELRRDGAVQLRYGAGNTNLYPVVGISAGEPEAYVVASHTSEASLNNLTNAPAVAFVPRAVLPSTLQFTAPSYSVAENGNRAVVTVTRSGDLSGAASIDYATSDSTPFVRCDTVTGTASARCDYSTSLDKLSFAAGEATKTLSIPILDDSHVEGDETLTVTLSNPTGAAFGAQSTATLTITDNDTAASTSNPIDNTSFYVTQQYLDFLSREPEPDGFNAWVGVLNRCNGGFANSDPTCDRIEVSASFFRSEEFQFKGFFVYRFYSTSFGRRPTYAEIIPDMRRVTGQTGEEVIAKKTFFSNQWIERPDFKAIYDGLPNAAFVIKLVETADVQLPNQDQLIADLNSGSITRAQALRAVVESQAVLDKQYNRAFVAMQYFGYLRRDPEEEGYQRWLNVIDRNPADYRTMVQGFATSVEYRLRFGQP